jgi:hypothetical protein
VVSGACTGDIDQDGNVLASDFSVFQPPFGKCFPDLGYDPRADLDGDGCVLASDFSLFQPQFGNTGCPSCVQ